MESAAPETRSPSSCLTPRKLLIRGVNWLGDAVMTTPALMRLRQYVPEARISLLTHQKLAELWRHHPALDEVLTIQPGESIWSIARRIRAEGFDVALVLPNSPRSALEMWLSGIPHRIGYARPWRSWLLTEAVPTRPGRVRMHRRSTSEIRRLVAGAAKPGGVPEPRVPEAHSAGHQMHDYLLLASRLGANPAPLSPRLEITPEEVQAVEVDLVVKWGAPVHAGKVESNRVWLGLNPSAAYGSAKCWPAENFAAVVGEVSSHIPSSVWLIFGDARDRELCERIARSSHGRCVNLAGKTSLRELMALLKLCRVVLTNDSGPMHVAAALGTPVVVPFGSTSPELTAPGLPGEGRHRLIQSAADCSPCFRRTCPIDFRCMKGIPVERVAATVQQVFEESQASSKP
jgi:heptosyltransferase-2